MSVMCPVQGRAVEELCWGTRMAAARQGQCDGALGGRGVSSQVRWSQGTAEACEAVVQRDLAYGCALELCRCFNSKTFQPWELSVVCVSSSSHLSLPSVVTCSPCHYLCHVSLSAAPSLQDCDNPESHPHSASLIFASLRVCG